mgnify:CR=1 FL=1
MAQRSEHEPDEGGHFGVYGGRHVPEALMAVIERKVAGEAPATAFECTAKVRYRQADQRCHAEVFPDGHCESLTEEECEAIGQIGDNKGCMSLKGGNPECEEAAYLPDLWQLTPELEAIGKRWGIDPRGDLVETHARTA